MPSPSGLRGVRGAGRAVVVCAALLFASACDLLWDTDVNPEQVRVRVESDTGGDIQLVLGDRFFLGGTDEGDGASTVTLISADTLLVSLPYDESFPLAPTFQFYVQPLPDTLGAPRNIRVQVLIDGDSRYDKSGTLGVEDFEFVYNFN